MLFRELELNSQSIVTEIVKMDYRTAEVFQKYGIEYCCGASWPIATVCLMNGIEENILLADLKKATRTITLPSHLSFSDWAIDFLIDYIIHVYHQSLEKKLPAISTSIIDFTVEHGKQYPYMALLQKQFEKFQRDCLLHIQYEEEVIFPYLRHVAHAFEKKEAFAQQLVRTLRKPIAKTIEQDAAIFQNHINTFRELTNGYTTPHKTCTNHSVVFSKLKEIEQDLAQHIYLENDVLFPRIIEMEKVLLDNDIV